MAEPFKSTPASRVFGMGLPRRSNLPPATFFGTPIAEERRFLNPKLRQNALAEQELEAKENALAAEQAKRDMELKGQEAMGRAFEELSQGEDIENIFRKNPAIVFSPQFDQLSRATEFVQPSKAVKSLVPNLAKSLPPEFRSEFIAKASNLTNTDEVLGAYTDTELKKSMAEQRGRLGELGVDISQLKPDYLYTPAEEAAFKTKAATAREMAKLDLERKKTSEGALEQARQWALKRGAQANLVNMLDNPSAIYQLGASIGGSRNEAASRQIIDRKSRLFSIAKNELEDAKRDFKDSEFDDLDVIDAKQKILDAAQERYNQARSDFENVLIEPPVEEEGLPGMQLPYDLYSVGGIPSATKEPAISPAAQRGAATAKDITSSAATGGLSEREDFKQRMAKLSDSAKPAADGAPVIPNLTPEEKVKDIDSNKTDPVFLIAAINSPQRDEKSKDVAFKYLKELQKDPKKIQFSYGNPSDIQKAKRDIQKTIEFYPALKEVNRAWTSEKKNIESQIKDFAKANNITASLMKNWLKNNVQIDFQFDPTGINPPREILTREAFDTFLRDKNNMSLLDDAPILTKFAQKYPKMIQELGLDRWFGLKISEVLDAYLDEKPTNQGDNQGQSTNAAANTVANITTKAEFDKLPIGTKFTFGSGEIRTKERERKK